MRRIAVLLAVGLVVTGAGFAGAATSTSSGSSGETPAVAGPRCGGEQPYKPDGTPWVCTFDDEFDATTGDATTLDPSKWTVQLSSTGGYVTGTAPYQACYVATPNNVAVSGGVLNLTVRAESAPFTCQTGPYSSITTQYTAGMVSTADTFNQTYGRFEVRAKLPSAPTPTPTPTPTCNGLARLLNLCAPGSAAPTSTGTSTATTCQGLQLLLGMCSVAPPAPAAPPTTGLQETFWLWPVDAQHYGAWPRSGEIDFAEFFGDYPDRVIPYIHYSYASSDPSTNTNVVTNNTSCKIDPAGFNTYDVEWEPGTITVGYNGVTCLTDHYVPNGGLTSPQPFDQPFFVALTQALGVAPNAAGATTPIPATTSVDYVRVWK